MPHNKVIALVPLDERPVNTRYPEMLAEIAGATVLLPPEDIRGYQRTPADLEAVSAWLKDAAHWADGGVIASVEFLAYGNLISSRISNESAADALARLRVLEEITGDGNGSDRPGVYAFSVITRVSNADDCVEEPEYWATYGTRFYRYSALLHKRDSGTLGEGDVAVLVDLEASLPGDLRRDWLQRRLRNHTINLSLIDLLVRERLDFLLITSDDTSPWGTPSREKRWLESWLNILGSEVQARTMMHPGADEVGSALIARLIAQQRLPKAPRIYPLYAIPGDEEIVAPYEDRAVQLTVEGQIRACGGERAASAEEADIVLGVLTPSPRRREFSSEFAEAEREARMPFYHEFFASLARYQDAGLPVALGDVAYPNGADPLAIDMMLDPKCPLDPARLAAYGAWNTAGNTLGVVVAQAVCSLLIEGHPERAFAQRRFLAHRFLEDWGYQAVVRREARAWNLAHFGASDPDPANPLQVAATSSVVHTGLRFALSRLQLRGIGAGLIVDPDKTSLPWNRTFEVDFELRPERDAV